jgi:hypothetical protein
MHSFGRRTAYHSVYLLAVAVLYMGQLVISYEQSCASATQGIQHWVGLLVRQGRQWRHC